MMLTIFMTFFIGTVLAQDNGLSIRPTPIPNLFNTSPSLFGTGQSSLFQNTGNIVTGLKPTSSVNLMNLNNMNQSSMLFKPQPTCNALKVSEPPTTEDGRVVLFEVKYSALPTKSGETFRQTSGGFNSPYKSIYADLETSATSEILDSKIQAVADGMTDDQYKDFLADLADYLPYSWDRASFKQSSPGGKGAFTPFELLTQQESAQGICGDHHLVVSRFAEAKGWEAITIGYNVDRSQHVISGIIDPKDPDHITLINYNSVQENDISGTQEMNLSNNRGSYEDLSTMYRIFKGKGDKQVQIGNLDNSLRGFLLNLSKREYELNKAYMGNQNYNQTVVGTRSPVKKTITTKDGGKIVEREMTTGVSVYQGNTNDHDIFGIYVSKDVYKRMKDEQGREYKSRYYSQSIANSFLNFKDFDSSMNMVNIYINIHGGTIYHLYESEYFKFGGILGYQVDGYLAVAEVLAGDGNFEGFAQAYAEYSKGNTYIKLAGKLDTTIGLRDQRYMTDLKQDFLGGNVTPFRANAVGVDLNVKQKIGPNTSLVSNNSAMISALGNRIVMSSGILHNNTSVMVGYQGGFGSMRLGNNSVKSVNMLQNSTGVDGMNLTFAQNFQYKSINGTASAWVQGIKLGPQATTPFVGGTVKMNIGTKPKAKKPASLSP